MIQTIVYDTIIQYNTVAEYCTGLHRNSYTHYLTLNLLIYNKLQGDHSPDTLTDTQLYIVNL